MATSTSSSPSPPPTPFRRRTRTCARRCERYCCAVATFFPLAFVYGLTTWAAWVEGGIGLSPPGKAQSPIFFQKPLSAVGVLLYLLLNTCYTVAAFTDPGSPSRQPSTTDSTKYSSLPTHEPNGASQDLQNVTVSSTGLPRYCKKCHTSKPDRTHHCSTCRRCVLKMDHHCPWLATCLGLRNYKAFILFLFYTTLFCWVCFLSSARWTWTNLFEQSQYLEEFAPVNIIMLTVISGIIGFVLTGFTSWHLYLCIRGQTTIECLEKTRYLSGVRMRVEKQRQEQINGHRRSDSQGMAGTLQRAGEQILEFHANAVPGATRYEEGEEHTSPILDARPVDPMNESPAQRALRRTYSSIEDQRERDRYQDYLDEQESDKLPNAFDLGWKRNLSHLFGPKPILWFFPVCNTTGDGWRWEVNQKWIEATNEASRRRERRLRGASSLPQSRDQYDGAADYDVELGTGMSMKTLKRPGHAWGKSRQRREFDHADSGELDHFEVSSDEDTDDAWEDNRRGNHDINGRR